MDIRLPQDGICLPLIGKLKHARISGIRAPFRTPFILSHPGRNLGQGLGRPDPYGYRNPHFPAIRALRSAA